MLSVAYVFHMHACIIGWLCVELCAVFVRRRQSFVVCLLMCLRTCAVVCVCGVFVGLCASYVRIDLCVCQLICSIGGYYVCVFVLTCVFDYVLELLLERFSMLSVMCVDVLVRPWSVWCRLCLIIVGCGCVMVCVMCMWCFNIWLGDGQLNRSCVVACLFVYLVMCACVCVCVRLFLYVFSYVSVYVPVVYVNSFVRLRLFSCMCVVACVFVVSLVCLVCYCVASLCVGAYGHMCVSEIVCAWLFTCVLVYCTVAVLRLGLFTCIVM